MDDYIILKKQSAALTRARSFTNLAAGDASLALTTERLSIEDAAKLAAEPDVQEIASVMPTRLIEPLDAGASSQFEAWGLVATGADRSPYQGTGVTVAVLDTGIDKAHPAFTGVSLIEEDFSGDGNGDRQGHGTHCAGTIFGRGSAPRIGVAPNIPRALIGKVLRDSGSGSSEMIFRGLQWAAEQGANIISMSLGFDFPGLVAKRIASGVPAELATSEALDTYRHNLRMFDRVMAMLQARCAFGGAPLVIAAAGNESRRATNPVWRIAAGLPAAAEGVISVAAVGRSGDGFQVAPFSNSHALVCAPGVDILSAAAGGGLKTLSGTSMACPHVAGLAALWWEAMAKTRGRATPVNVQTALLGSARRERLMPAPLTIDFGEGFVTAPQNLS